MLLGDVGDTLRGVDALTTTVNQFPVWAAIAAGLAVGVDRLFLLPALIFAASYVLLSRFPDLAFPTMSACNLVVLLLIVRVSRQPSPKRRHETRGAGLLGPGGG